MGITIQRLEYHSHFDEDATDAPFPLLIHVDVFCEKPPPLLSPLKESLRLRLKVFSKLSLPENRSSIIEISSKTQRVCDVEQTRNVLTRPFLTFITSNLAKDNLHLK
jgi:hypothetical protein